MARNEPKTVPSGIDYLVSLAASDARFRERLLADRLKAAKRAGVRLTESEKTLLQAMPEAQLAAIVDSTAPRLAPRRGFLQKAGLWAAGLFGGVAMTTLAGGGCGTKGIQPDEPPPRTQGIRPDEPKERRSMGIRPDQPPAQSAGERPDVPPERADANGKTESDGGP